MEHDRRLLKLRSDASETTVVVNLKDCQCLQVGVHEGTNHSEAAIQVVHHASEAVVGVDTSGCEEHVA